MKKLFSFILILIFSNSVNLFSEEIPIIVISPGKTLQSKSVVGSDIEVIDRETISNSHHFLLEIY